MIKSTCTYVPIPFIFQHHSLWRQGLYEMKCQKQRNVNSCDLVASETSCSIPFDNMQPYPAHPRSWGRTHFHRANESSCVDISGALLVIFATRMLSCCIFEIWISNEPQAFPISDKCNNSLCHVCVCVYVITLALEIIVFFSDSHISDHDK